MKTNKKSGGLYVYAQKKNGWIFLERGKYRLHLAGKYEPSEGRDRFIFTAAKELGYDEFKNQFANVLIRCAEMWYPVLSLYEKDDQI